MEEWISSTVTRILDLHPRSVLEIGCGIGLLLAKIAPQCERYVGTDFSSVPLKQLKAHLDQKQMPQEHIQLLQRAADDFRELSEESFDTVILNSVVQYFPSYDYFYRVMAGAVRRVKSGGKVFIGDIRSFGLQEAFHLSVQLYQASTDWNIAEIKSRIHQSLTQEEELTIDPAFFYLLQQQFPEITHVAVLLKRGDYPNELNCFRYDVVLEIDKNPDKTSEQEVDWVHWDQMKSLDQIKQRLTDQQPECFGMTGIPNQRVHQWVQVNQFIHSAAESVNKQHIDEYMEQIADIGIQPELFWQLAEETGYQAEISYSPYGLDCYDVLWKKKNTFRAVFPLAKKAKHKPLRAYVSNPVQSKMTKQIIPMLKTHLRERLPEYMVPTHFIVLDSFPYMTNGKVDRRQLPSPEEIRPMIETVYASPNNEWERALVKIWQEVLQLDHIGVQDNFFDLGGNSLLMVQMHQQVQQRLSAELSVIELFRYPTIYAIAAHLQSKVSSQSAMKQSQNRAAWRREQLKNRRKSRGDRK
jgi:ubiquinone/menaquinone biosynthesis C-methylase UbiE/acyl carrier protein